MAETERMRGIIEIETVLRELHQLIDELVAVQAAIDFVDGQEVKIHAETRGFETAMGQILALRGMGTGAGGRGSGTGVPDVSGAGGGAAAAGGGFLSNLSEADIRMTDLHNALAKAVPLILVIIGALPALIAGIVGLAAAAVAATAALLGIAGFGALGFAMAEGDNLMEGMMEILETIRDDFLDAFTPLAQQLAPLFRDALDGLNTFFQALADQGDALLMFEQVARNFGSFLIRELPSFIAFLADMARAFEPVFAAIAAALFDSNLGEGFMNFMADVMPALMDFGALLASLLPMILEWSIGFLKVTNAILLLLKVLFEVLSLGGLLNEELGFLMATMLALATATFLWNSALLTAARTAIVSLSRAVATAIGMLLGYEANTIAATIATHGLTIAVLTLIGVLTLGIGAAATLSATIGTVGSKFNELTGGANRASQAIRNFDRTTSRMDGPRSNAFTPGSTPVRGGSSKSGGGSVHITVEGDANDDTVETQARNANFRLNRTS